MQTLMNQSTNQLSLMRTGAVCAILGAVIQVAAGTGSSLVFGAVPSGAEADALLPILANQPLWAWTILHLGFVLGPVFWVVTFVALIPTLPGGWRGTLATLAAVTILVGAAPHIVSSSLNGFAVPALAHAWESAASTDQSSLILIGNLLLTIIDGTWASSITLFHGLPFVLSGLAVVSSGRYPALLGWVGFVGGLGSLITGPFMFFGAEGLPIALSIVSAVVISLYMIILGFLLWNPPSEEQ